MIIKRKLYSAGLNLAFTGLDAAMTTGGIVKSSKEFKQNQENVKKDIASIKSNTANAIKEQEQAGENFRNSLKI